MCNILIDKSCPAGTMSKGRTSENSKELRFSWKEGTFYMSITRKNLSEGIQMGGTKWPLEPRGLGQGPLLPKLQMNEPDYAIAGNFSYQILIGYP